METQNIYKLYSADCPELVYIGSTKSKINVRLAQHRCDFRRFKAGKIKNCTMSKEIFENSDINNVKIEVLEVVNDQVLQRERYYIDNNNCVNKNKPLRTGGEWRDDNKEDYLKYQRIYREDNKERLKEQQNKKNTCSICGGSFTNKNKIIHGKTKKHIKALNNKK